MRFGIGDYTPGFWVSKTNQGFSMGPMIPGEEHVHLTFFADGEVVNAHLTIVEDGTRQYKNLTVMSPYQFQQKMKQTATNALNSFEPISPDEDAILIPEKGKIFQKLLGGSITITHKGRKACMDFDFGMLLEEVQNLAEDPYEYITIGKARDIVGSDYLQFGATMDGVPIFPLNDQIYSWGIAPHDTVQNIQSQDETEDVFSSLRQTRWGRTVYEFTSIMGIPQLFSEIEQRKLFEKWFSRTY